MPTEELYLLMRAGELVPLEDFVDRVRAYLAAVEAEPGRVRDRARVVVVGAFCEQPPLGLVKTIERAGCFIVDDDFVLGNRMIDEDVSLEGDPLRESRRRPSCGTRSATPRSTSPTLTESGGSSPTEWRPRGPTASSSRRRASAIRRCSTGRCCARAPRAAGIPCIAFQFAENTGQFQQFREQAGTFADAIKLWGGA